MKTLICLIVCALALFAAVSPVKAERNINAPEGACALCEFAVAYVENYANASQAQIVAAVEKLCHYAPKDYQSMCQGFVAAYGPTIIKHFIEKNPPHVLCAKFRLCEAKTPVQTEKIQESLQCTFCKYVIEIAEGYLNSSATQAQIEAALKTACESLDAPLAGQCKLMVQFFLPTFIHNIINNFPPEKACQAARLCTDEVKIGFVAPIAPIAPIAPVAPVEQSNDMKCVACEYIITWVENQLINDKTEGKIIEALDKVCNILPGTLKGECLEIVDVYAPLIIKLLISKADPGTVCAIIGLCNRAPAPVAPKVEIAQPNSIGCTICEWVISELEATVTSDASIAEIEAALAGICKKLPIFQSSCSSFVSQYTQVIIHALINKLPPTEVCAKIGLCASEAVVAAPAPANDVKCVVCEWIMTIVESQITKDSTKEQIEEIMGKVCTVVPPTVRPVCDHLVKQYTPLIIDLIASKVSPSFVCTKAKLCAASAELEQVIADFRFKKSDAFSAIEITKVDTTATNSQFCPLCKAIVGYLESQLTKESTTEAIISAVSKVCDHVPAGLQSQCKVFVPVIAQDLIKILIAKAPPATVCSLLGVCESSKKTLSAGDNGLVCDACHYAVNYADAYITKNSTKTEIEAILERVCDQLLPAYKPICVAMVQQYTPALIEQLVQKYGDPVKVCQAVGACPKAKMFDAITRVAVNVN